MIRARKKIIVYVVCDGEEHVIETYPHEYRNLMMLIYDRIVLEDFGECMGMGKCGTCLIEIVNDTGKVSYYDRNENTTMEKLMIKDDNIRLSCQILIDEGIDGLRINLGNYKLLGK